MSNYKMSNSTNMRSDPDFNLWLKKIKTKRYEENISEELEGDRKLTKKLLSCKSLKLLEKELTMSKKGALTDLFVWVVVGLILVIFLGGWLYAHNILTGALLEASYQSTGGVNFTGAVESTFVQVNAGLGVFSWGAGAIIFAIGISILISNFLVKVNPVFLVPYFLIVIIAIIFSVFLSNAYETAILPSSIGSTVQGFGGANFIFLHLPIWIGIIGFLGGIVMFIGIIRDRDTGGGIV